MVLLAAGRTVRPSLVSAKDHAPVLSNGIQSAPSVVEQRETKRTRDITDLQRRLSHLTNAIDDTLHRGGDKRVASSPAPSRPASTPIVPEDKPSAPARTAVIGGDVPTTRVFSLVSRSSSSASTTNYSRGASATTAQQPAGASVTNARPVSPPHHRKRLMSPDLVHGSQRGEGVVGVPLVAVPQPVVPQVSVPASSSRHVVDPQESDSAPLASTKQYRDTARAQLVLDDPLPALREEESDIRLRIAALKRIEAEKMELIAHQKRLIELDNERHRLEDERRRGRSSRGCSGSLVSAASPATGTGFSLSPQPQRMTQHQVYDSDETDQEVVSINRRTRATEQMMTSAAAVRAVTPPRQSAPTVRDGRPVSTLPSSSAFHYSSRSPSPILRFQSASPSSQTREESTHRILRNAISSTSSGGGGLNHSGMQHKGGPTPGGPRWVPTAKGDQRFVCRELLVERGIDAKVLTGHDRAIPCKVHLSPNHQELLALPVDDSGGLMTESHHFPLKGAALLYPNGMIQHSWLPRRVHVSGVVVGNRAKSVLLAKGCPHFISTARENRPRLYLVVGGDAYSEEATLLVLQFGSRLEWLCVLLGLHGAMWPDGKPPLTPGRALWLYACHAVTQLQWEANTTSDNLWHQSRRRSRSAEPHQRIHHNASRHQQQQQIPHSRTSTPPPQRLETSATPVNTSYRFAVPATPTVSTSPPRPVSTVNLPHYQQHVILSSNSSDARSTTLAAPSQLSRVYPSFTNRPFPGLQATQMVAHQQLPPQASVMAGARGVPNQGPLAKLPNGFVLVGSNSSNASSLPPSQRLPQPQQEQQQQPPGASNAAPRSTFFPKSQSRQSGGRQSVLQYGY
jgi:hypothetical protein